jgi:hypothetical protein
MIRGFRVTRKGSVLAPLLPLTFVVAYQVRAWSQSYDF